MQNDLARIARDFERVTDRFFVSIDQAEIGRAVTLLAGDPAQRRLPFRTRCRINEKSSFIIRQCRTNFVSPMIVCPCMGGRKRPLHHYAGERQSGFLFDHLTRNRQQGSITVLLPFRRLHLPSRREKLVEPRRSAYSIALIAP